MTRKEIVNVLDACAQRAEYADAEPATQKQCWYLAGLLEKAGSDLAVFDSNYVLTKRRASKLIESHQQPGG